MKEKESTPLLIWIAVIMMCVGVPLCYGIDIYNTRIDAGDSFNEAFKAASIVFAAFLIIPNSFIFFIMTLVQAEMNKN